MRIENGERGGGRSSISGSTVPEPRFESAKRPFFLPITVAFWALRPQKNQGGRMGRGQELILTTGET